MKPPRRLVRGYSALTAEERARLVIAADARGDEHEFELLMRSAPRLAYLMRDPAFDARLRDLHFWAVAASAVLDNLWQRLVVIDTCELGVRRFFIIAADLAESRVYDLTGQISDAVRRAVFMGGVIFIRNLRTMRNSLIDEGALNAHLFAGFCRDELGIEATDLLAVFAPTAVDLFTQFLSFPVDPERALASQKKLQEEWASRGHERPSTNDRGRAT